MDINHVQLSTLQVLSSSFDTSSELIKGENREGKENRSFKQWPTVHVSPKTLKMTHTG